MAKSAKAKATQKSPTFAWQPPENYEPDPSIPGVLIHGSPGVGTPLFDMVVYWQWTHYWWKNKTIDTAWADLHMSPANARKAIDQKIVPLEIYEKVLSRALEDDI
jgi:hypothetical protein